jgi:predicted ATP-dependent serine protease
MAEQRMPSLQGRSAERNVLDRLLEDTHAGRGGAVVLHGEAGIGKSTLLQYAARQADGLALARVVGLEAEKAMARRSTSCAHPSSGT